MEIVAAFAAGVIACALIFRQPEPEPKYDGYVDSKVEESKCPIEARLYSITVLEGKVIYCYKGKYIKPKK